MLDVDSEFPWKSLHWLIGQAMESELEKKVCQVPRVSEEDENGMYGI